MLLSSPEKDARVKIIDFGTSEFCVPGQKLQDKFGTPYYVAPEVSRGGSLAVHCVQNQSQGESCCHSRSQSAALLQLKTCMQPEAWTGLLGRQPKACMLFLVAPLHLSGELLPAGAGEEGAQRASGHLECRRHPVHPSVSLSASLLRL